MMSRYKPVGWRGESYRHYLARKGVKTKYRPMVFRGRPGVVGQVRGIPIVAQKLPRGQAYPIAPRDIKQHLMRAKPEDTRGLKMVEFAPPRGEEQKDAWAQFVRSKRKILIFSQPIKGGKIAGRKVDNVQKLMERYVIPHELGHHVALRDLPTDKRLKTAEARADAYAFGMDVRDRDIKMFERLHSNA